MDLDKNPKNIGDYVEVIYTGVTYPEYNTWFGKNNCDRLLDLFVLHKSTHIGMRCIVLAKGTHGRENIMLYAIQDTITQQVYIIAEAGIRIISENIDINTVRLEDFIEF